ncbi:MAG TPA: serine hydrolase domain-containing protein [Blastocatellia bacterium]|nr:serine hydrolase domain-containing protein [Blastocatellia bacterium]
MASEEYARVVEQARVHIQAMMSERQIPGLSICIAVAGKTVWSEGFGFADRERQIQACPSTRFRIASVSKTLTAAAMARLYEQGRLDLDAPIQKYVPGFPDKGRTITARQLASHRSGVRGYHDDLEAVSLDNCRSVTASLEHFKNDPLAFAPDSDFLYSGYGYALLGAVIEGASGEDYLTCIRRQVFEPLQMSHTVEDQVDAPAPNQSRFYDNVTPYSVDGLTRPSPRGDLSCKLPSGGFISTAEDLARFGSAHIPALEGGFLKSETLEMLFAPRTRQGGVLGHGMGWMTARDLRLRRALFHFGAGSGATSALAIFPNERLSVAILANLGHAKFPFARLMGVVNPFLN